jgi:hypothetical protein
MTIAFGSSPGAKAVDALMARIPVLVDIMAGRRAHA